MDIGRALAPGSWPSVALSVLVEFFFRYSLTMLAQLRADIALRDAPALACAAGTASIAIMEPVDNTLMLLIRGAMEAGLASGDAARPQNTSSNSFFISAHEASSAVLS